MKTIGLIGGMSWESSALYYQLINRTVKKKLGGLHSGRCLLYSFDFEEIARLQHQGDWDRLQYLMVDAANRLERGGADFLVLCTNTMHKLAGAIEQNTDIPFLHIADATAQEIKKHQFTKVGLLGTKYTMEGDFLKSRLWEKHQVETIIPDEQARERVHAIIYEELVKGIFTDASRKECQTILNGLMAEGAEGIILGCTELPLLVTPQDTEVVLFDTTTLHAVQAAELALR